MLHPGITVLELEVDGPHADAADLFVAAGSCDSCAGVVCLEDLETADGLCALCRLTARLNLALT